MNGYCKKIKTTEADEEVDRRELAQRTGGETGCWERKCRWNGRVWRVLKIKKYNLYVTQKFHYWLCIQRTGLSMLTKQVDPHGYCDTTHSNQEMEII